MLDVPEAHRPRARYALRMLLYPMGLRPRWITAAEAGDTGIYYGSGARPGRGWVLVSFVRRTARYFDRQSPYDARPPYWFFEESAKVPVLFPRGSALRSRPPGEGPSTRWDLIASAFFWLARWPEWTGEPRDRHGRPRYEGSLQERWELGDCPAVDLYRTRLARLLRSAGIPVRWRDWDGDRWAFAPTHDVDYGRKWRPGILYREFVSQPTLPGEESEGRGRLARTTAAVRQLFGTDPYRRSLERMLEEEQVQSVGATYFLKGGAESRHDVAYSLDRGFVSDFIDRLREAGLEIGLHPGYYSGDHPERYRAESGRLAERIGTPVRLARHHYLRYHDPVSARIQRELGIVLDASLGWPDREGFRSGTTVPHLYFDRVANETLPLWQVPLTAMDSTFFGYRDLGPEEALDRTAALMRICRRFRGLFTGLWHETAYENGGRDGADHDDRGQTGGGADSRRLGWGAHFEGSLAEARNRGARRGGLSALLRSYLEE